MKVSKLSSCPIDKLNCVGSLCPFFVQNLGVINCIYEETKKKALKEYEEWHKNQDNPLKKLESVEDQFFQISTEVDEITKEINDEMKRKRDLESELRKVEFSVILLQIKRKKIAQMRDQILNEVKVKENKCM